MKKKKVVRKKVVKAKRKTFWIIKKNDQSLRPWFYVEEVLPPRYKIFPLFGEVYDSEKDALIASLRTIAWFNESYKMNIQVITERLKESL